MSTLCCIWRQLPVVGVVPPNLCDHSMVYYGGRLFVFGGNPKWGESTTNETYACDLRTHHWAFVETEENPAARCAHTAHVHGKRMYIFGGCSADRSEFYTNIAYLDLESFRWTKLEAKTVPRAYHDSCVVDNKVYLIGGYGGEYYDPIMQIFSFDTHSIVPLYTVGAPFPRMSFDHTTTVVGRDIVVLAGLGGAVPVTGFFSAVINIDTLHCTIHHSDLPGRFVHTCTPVRGDALVMFGGRTMEDEYRALTDLLAFDPRTRRELPVRAEGRGPMAVAGHAAVCVNGDVYIHGGYNGKENVSHFHILHTGVLPLQTLCRRHICKQMLESPLPLPITISPDVADALFRELVDMQQLSMTTLPQFPSGSLRDISFNGSWYQTILSNEFLDELCRAQPLIESLDLKGCIALTQNIIKSLRRLSQLSMLDVTGCIALNTSEFLRECRALPSLRVLEC